MNKLKNISMNRLNSILILTIISLFSFLLCQCENNLETEESIQVEGLILKPDVCLPDVEDKYVYPDYEVLGHLTTEEEILAALQLPDDILNSISTFGLIRSILDFPWLWISYYASSNNSPIDRCYNAFSMYNCVPELEKRADNADALAAYYSAVSLNCFKSMSAEEQLCFSVQLTALEVLFIKPDILNKFDSAEKHKVVALMLQKYKEFNKLDARKGIGAIFSMAYIMYDDQYPPIVECLGPDIKLYEFFIWADIIDDIISFAESYTSKK